MKIIIVICIILIYYIQLLFILYYSEFCDIHTHEFIICNTVGYHISYIVKGNSDVWWRKPLSLIEASTTRSAPTYFIVRFLRSNDSYER